jgi:hypothetical protein
MMEGYRSTAGAVSRATGEGFVKIKSNPIFFFFFSMFCVYKYFTTFLVFFRNISVIYFYFYFIF